MAALASTTESTKTNTMTPKQIRLPARRRGRIVAIVGSGPSALAVIPPSIGFDGRGGFLTRH
jgi:hypothetical protein